MNLFEYFWGSFYALFQRIEVTAYDDLQPLITSKIRMVVDSFHPFVFPLVACMRSVPEIDEFNFAKVLVVPLFFIREHSFFATFRSSSAISESFQHHFSSLFISVQLSLKATDRVRTSFGKLWN